MKKSDIIRAIDKIKGYKSVCIIGHVDPDPDALCSMYAMREFLNTTFNIKNIDLFASCKDIPEKSKDILKGIELNPKVKKYEVAIVLDSPNLDRVCEYSALVEKAKYTLVIDHHATNNYFGMENLVENTSSTCEMIFEIFKTYKTKISPSCYERLYTGIMMDTMNFTVGNFTGKTMKLASECISHVDVKSIYDYFLGTHTVINLKMSGLVINNAEFCCDKRLIISFISKDDEKKYNTTYENYYGIVNMLNQTEGVQISCLIVPRNDNYYVNMRAKPGFDISEIAKRYGGGGHAGAAAFPTSLKLKEIIETMKKELGKLVRNEDINTSPFKKYKF